MISFVSQIFTGYKSALIIAVVFAFLSLSSALGQNNGLMIWAASDGTKVDKFDLNHPLKSGNYTWDKDTIRALV
jgi:hypothetical protein